MLPSDFAAVHIEKEQKDKDEHCVFVYQPSFYNK